MVVPAAIDSDVNDKIRQIAVRAYQTLGCSGMARVDVFLTAENDVVINEINTLPGFTNISMYPKLWQASGLDYTSLISRLIELALERHAADPVTGSPPSGGGGPGRAFTPRPGECAGLMYQPGLFPARAALSRATASPPPLYASSAGRRRIINPAIQKLITHVTSPTA